MRFYIHKHLPTRKQKIRSRRWNVFVRPPSYPESTDHISNTEDSPSRNFFLGSHRWRAKGCFPILLSRNFPPRFRRQGGGQDPLPEKYIIKLSCWLECSYLLKASEKLTKPLEKLIESVWRIPSINMKTFWTSWKMTICCGRAFRIFLTENNGTKVSLRRMNRTKQLFPLESYWRQHLLTATAPSPLPQHIASLHHLWKRLDKFLS